MSLAPLFGASAPIIIHTAAALTAFVIGSVQLAAPKGTLPHRTLGWIWVVMMATVVLTSFPIHTICTIGSFSPIHGLSLFTILVLPVAVLHARKHRVKSHARAMVLLFVGALCIAGFFTLWPGRIMHDVAFGTATAHGTCG